MNFPKLQHAEIKSLDSIKVILKLQTKTFLALCSTSELAQVVSHNWELLLDSTLYYIANVSYYPRHLKRTTFRNTTLIFMFVLCAVVIWPLLKFRKDLFFVQLCPFLLLLLLLLLLALSLRHLLVFCWTALCCLFRFEETWWINLLPNFRIFASALELKL